MNAENVLATCGGPVMGNLHSKIISVKCFKRTTMLQPVATNGQGVLAECEAQVGSHLCAWGGGDNHAQAPPHK